MKSATRAFVQACVTCQQAKPDRTHLPGLLQPLPVPDAAWQTISMDFVEGLPRSGNVNCILVVVDSFTEYGHFLPSLAAIHLVFHVLQLKDAVLPHVQVSPSLPADIELPLVPMEVLQRRVIPTANGSV